MPTLKYSRQREAIKDYLSHTKEHPTADMVYTHVKEDFPNISLGTVYRNLNILSEIGEAIKITAPDGADRFDGCTSPHYHFFCTECGSVIDLKMDDISYINEIAGRNFDGAIERHSAVFFGKCGNCIKKQPQPPIS